MNEKIKGQVLLCGIANAGKSTLINKISKYDFALVNKKPQTTRKESKFLYEDENHEILFVDTPGFHFAKNKLDEYMNEEIYKNFKKSNCVCFLYDISKELDSKTIFFLNELNKKVGEKLNLIFTKIDLINPNELEHIKNIRLTELKKYLKIKNCFSTSYLDQDFLKKLLHSINFALDKDKAIFFSNIENDNFIISEKIRGIILNLLKQEIPYGIHVHVEDKKYNSDDNVFYIEAYIFCESKSKKGIIIGSGGSMIKEIGIKSRAELLKIFNAKIYLDLKVKVLEDWRNNINFIKKYI